MYRDVAHLLMYSNLGKDSILLRLSEVLRDWERGGFDRDELVRRIYREIKRLLELGTSCGFDENLWHCYLTWLLMTNRNAFTLTCERSGSREGTVNGFVKADFAVFRRLFHYDFSPIEKDLGLDCFTAISHYSALPKRDRIYNRDVSWQVRVLSRALAQARDEEDIFSLMTSYYRQYGFGLFAMNRAFRIQGHGKELEFLPITNVDRVMLEDLLGYEKQKEELRRNTEAFLDGKHANNVLLYGDAGTGKSTSVKALVNEYFSRGLRMIEIYKHQFKDLSDVIAQIKNRNYKFVIYMDDLSFEEFEIEYKFLKAVIEGGVETKPDNVLIYATSNRRHLIKETWNDRSDVEVDNGMHRSDTMEEKLSLVNRFGVTINFSKPSQKEYFNIVLELAHRQGIHMPDEELRAEANKWELSHGGISGRTAQQFVHYLDGQSGI